MECKCGLTMRILSVCLPVCQARGLWQNGRKICSDFYTISYERSFSLVFWEEEWLVGATPSTWNYGSTGPRWSEVADFEPIFARSASAVTLDEPLTNSFFFFGGGGSYVYANFDENRSRNATVRLLADIQIHWLPQFETQTDFITCPMQYAIAKREIIITLWIVHWNGKLAWTDLESL